MFCVEHFYIKAILVIKSINANHNVLRRTINKKPVGFYYAKGWNVLRRTFLH